MDVLFNLLSILFGEKDNGLEKIFGALKSNSFDLLKTLSSLDLSALLPIIESLFKSESSAATGFNFAKSYNADELSAIKKIADEEIVATLNGYFVGTGA